ncbi:MAG: DUF6483 family protein [Trueperaceae bacterium]|nr:DUF6483 family protein [Trueperaceae bacterium]
MPIRDDLVLRTIRQISQILAYLMGQRDQATFERLIRELDQVYRDQLGVPRSLMHDLDGESLIEILSSTGRLDCERAFLLSELLRAEAIGMAARDRPVPPELRVKALNLALAAAAEGSDIEELPERINEHQEALDGVDLPEPTLWRLFDYRVQRGGYAGAEDLLFEALDRFGAGPTARDRGRAFYRDLRSQRDGALREGGLPREELEEGAAALEARLRAVGEAEGH